MTTKKLAVDVTVAGIRTVPPPEAAAKITDRTVWASAAKPTPSAESPAKQPRRRTRAKK